MTLAIVLASIAAYFGVGWILAKHHLPRAWENARKNWSIESSVRESVGWAFTFTFALWPVVIPARWVRRQVAPVLTSGDPRAVEAARRDAERERDELRLRVAEMERELGIGGSG